MHMERDCFLILCCRKLARGVVCIKMRCQHLAMESSGPGNSTAHACSQKKVRKQHRTLIRSCSKVHMQSCLDPPQAHACGLLDFGFFASPGRLCSSLNASVATGISYILQAHPTSGSARSAVSCQAGSQRNLVLRLFAMCREATWI